MYDSITERRLNDMALEVAHAYDENKNLVPLYIVTDSDPVYEPTTPGFVYDMDNYGDSPDTDANLTLNIMSNAMNPTGGTILDDTIQIPLSDSINAHSLVRVYINNQTSFDLKVTTKFRVQILGYNTRTYNFSGISVPNNTNLLVNSDFRAYDDFSLIYFDNLYIQRVM